MRHKTQPEARGLNDLADDARRVTTYDAVHPLGQATVLKNVSEVLTCFDE